MLNKQYFIQFHRFQFKLINADCYIEAEKGESEVKINAYFVRTSPDPHLIDNMEFMEIIDETLWHYNIRCRAENGINIIRVNIENMGLDDAGALQDSLEERGFKTFIHQEWQFVNA